MLVSFSLIYIVSQSFAVGVSPEPGSFVRAQSVQTSGLERDKQPSKSATYTTEILHITTDEHIPYLRRFSLSHLSSRENR